MTGGSTLTALLLRASTPSTMRSLLSATLWLELLMTWVPTGLQQSMLLDPETPLSMRGEPLPGGAGGGGWAAGGTAGGPVVQGGAGGQEGGPAGGARRSSSLVTD